MSAQEIVTFFVYLVGSVTFILGLKFLSSPVSARYFFAHSSAQSNATAHGMYCV